MTAKPKKRQKEIRYIIRARPMESVYIDGMDDIQRGDGSWTTVYALTAERSKCWWMALEEAEWRLPSVQKQFPQATIEKA